MLPIAFCSLFPLKLCLEWGHFSLVFPVRYLLRLPGTGHSNPVLEALWQTRFSVLLDAPCIVGSQVKVLSAALKDWIWARLPYDKIKIVETPHFITKSCCCHQRYRSKWLSILKHFFLVFATSWGKFCPLHFIQLNILLSLCLHPLLFVACYLA